ncbi:MAG: right-handed parallel beta-helix repeat-containing protein [Deltaproteobacteria bacterium]|nr:right-handed parallel beta-helix repeat-containing protein [Deltaproteobacteria bacterium]
MYSSVLAKSHLIALLVLAMPLSGCPEGDDDDSAAEEGAVVVSGVGSFDNIQDAIDAAPDCANISIAPGIYDERLQIDKCITIVGAGQDQVRITGGGGGTIVDIDQVDGPVLLAGFQVYGPTDEVGTIRGVRVTDSTNVTLNDLYIGFEPDPATNIDNGNVGVDVSRSTVVIADTTIQRVGFGSEVGGACVQAQTDSDISIEGSTLEGGGSFGVHAVGGSLYMKDTEVLATNRSTGAQQFEADGSGIYAEDFSEGVTLDNVTVMNGSFVAAWMDVPSLTVNGGSFGSFAYGVYLPGDPASASGRNMTVTGATFTDLVQLGVLSVASAVITGNTFVLATGATDLALNRPYGALRVVAPGGTADISGNIISGTGSVDSIRVLGNTNDGNVSLATISANTVENVVAANGIQVVQADQAIIEDNIVSGVDHAYHIDNDNPGNNGLIVNGFGLACFQVDDCATSNNEISGAEFANLVIVNSFFTSVDDTLNGATWRAAQVEQSQGSFTNLTVADSQGVGVTFIDSTVEIETSSFTGQLRGTTFRDFDGNEDPLPEDIQYLFGGDAIENFSQGSAAFLSITDSVFTDNVDSALVSQDSQLVFTGNTLTNNGYEYDDGSGIVLGPTSALQVFRGDPQAVNGPLIQNNIIDGNEGAWAVNINGAIGAQFIGNTVCGGDSAGLFFSGNSGGLISNNWIGTSPAGDMTSCDDLEWTYQVYLSGNDAETALETIEVSDNQLGNAAASYGFFMSALGDFLFADNVVDGGTIAGIRAAATLPSGLTGDNDGDGAAEYQGDCNDDDPLVWWNRSTQMGAPEVAGDGLDNDCDGIADDGLDTSDGDGDGYSIADGDCDDVDPAVNPGAIEIVGNFKDDDCALWASPNGTEQPSRWADHDGVIPVPSLTLEGNTFTNLGAGLDLDGAQVVLSSGALGDNPNVFDGMAGNGMVVDDWIWSSSTPEQQAGSMVIEEGTSFLNVGGDCVVVQGEGTTVEADGVTFAGCGGSAVSMYDEGVVTLESVIIDSPGDAGVELGAGSIDMIGGSIDGAADGIVSQGGVLVADGVTISNSTNDGVRVLSSGVSTGDVTILGGSITGSLGDGVEVQTGDATLDATTISSSGLAGVHALSGTVSAVNVLVNGADVGVSIGGAAAVTLLGCTIDTTAGPGVEQVAGTLSMTNGTIQNCGGDGVLVTGASALNMDGPGVMDNAGYGMSCGPAVTSTTCSISASNNALGDLDGCGFCTIQ